MPSRRVDNHAVEVEEEEEGEYEGYGGGGGSVVARQAQSESARGEVGRNRRGSEATVGSMESTLLQQIRWSKRTYTLRMLLAFRQPPCIVKFSEGYKGNNEVENVPAGLVARVHSVFAERRVFARCVDGRVFSIPESFPIKFEVVKKSGKRGKAKRLDQILRNYRPPIMVVLDRKNNKWNFRNGKTVQSEDSLGTLVLFKAYFEHFARANPLIHGVIDRRIFLIPLYLDLDVRLAEGLKNGSSADFTMLMNMFGGAVQSLDYSSYSGLNAILVFDRLTGAVHPLASSGVPSRANSTPGVNLADDSRATTDEPPATSRSSLAGGSQGKGHGREVTGQRRRARSEDYAGNILTLESVGSGTTEGRTADTRGRSTDDSIGDGVFDEPQIVDQATLRSRDLNRERAQSTDDLYAQSLSRRNQQRTKSISLDHLNAENHARQSQNLELNYLNQPVENFPVVPVGGTREERLQMEVLDQAPVVIVNQHGSSPGSHGRSKSKGSGHDSRGHGSRGSRGQDSRGHRRPEVPAQTSDVAIRHQSSSRNHSRSRGKGSRSREQSGQQVQPTPKPRSSRSGNASEDSSRVLSQFVQAGALSTFEGHGQGQASLVTSTTQGLSTSSPNPNYHIHINIQSPPNSAPVQQQQSRPSFPHQQQQHQQQQWSTMSSREVKVKHSSGSRHPQSQTVLSNPYDAGTLPSGAGTLQFNHGSNQSRTTNMATAGSSRLVPYDAGNETVSRSRRRRVVSEDVNKPRQTNTQTYNTTSSRRGNRDIPPVKTGSRHHDRQNGAGNAYVTSVSCPGAEFSDQEPWIADGHRSNRLRSKVIQLQSVNEPKISDREFRDIYGRMPTTKQYAPVYGDGRDRNNNYNTIQSYSSTINSYLNSPANNWAKGRRSDGIVLANQSQARNRASANINLSAMTPDLIAIPHKVHDSRTQRFDSSYGMMADRGRNEEARGGGSRWIIKSYNHNTVGTGGPDGAVVRRHAGTTVVVD